MDLHYNAPAWLPGGDLQTIWAAIGARPAPGPLERYQRARWSSPDGDFVDVDWLSGTEPGAAAKPQTRPLLVLFHGLEGSSASHYALAFAHYARSQGWAYAVPHFRGCSGELNLAPRAYHSGDHEEVGWILNRFRAEHTGPIYVVGISMGGNALLRWAEEMGSQANQVVSVLASVCAPLDLTVSGHAMGRGLNRQIYTRSFMRSMKPRALAKLRQFPGLCDRARLEAANDLYAFDDVFTAPLHGFRSADDYWERASARPYLASIRVPALVANARNDPFVPASCLPTQRDAGPYVTLWQPAQGGHVGFPGAGFPGNVMSLPQQIGPWLRAQATTEPSARHG